MSRGAKRPGLLQAIGRFHNTRMGFTIFGLVELSLAIFVMNLAIPSGDWWEWLIGLILLVGFLQNFGRLIVGHT